MAASLARSWQPGEHITVVAPTGVGKTHLALELAEMRPYILVLATKQRDDLVEELGARGYLVTRNLRDDVLWTATRDGSPSKPVNPRIVYWPRAPETMSLEQVLALHQAAHRQSIHWANMTGKWTVVVDETMYMADQLRLGKELDFLWYQGRSQRVSLIACAQRPSRVPRLAFSQATYLFIGKFSDKRDIETLRDISTTIPRELIEEAIASLSKPEHEFLFLDTKTDQIAITVAPAR